MKKCYIFALMALALGLSACSDKNEPSTESSIISGELYGEFSVNAKQKVHFSQGNLQYQASTDTWRFAEHQWDMVGVAYGQTGLYNSDTIVGTVLNSDNRQISSTYSGWIDLFGWGTGDVPTKVSANLIDFSTFVDWGTNAITNGGNKANQWRTLTKDEWTYLFYGRTNAATLFGLGYVNGVNGAILLPDNWVLPDNASFVAGTPVDMGDYYSIFSEFWNNTYNEEQWKVMESSGAVFLPAAGFRSGTFVYHVGVYGNYWSSTLWDNTEFAYNFHFNVGYNNPIYGWARYYGQSVRLVR